ncbi:MAG: SpvB/TcaC N-terminal domain-containing protein, partial [Chloroflexota bacterium]
MYSNKPRAEITIRILLTAVVLSNALAPTAALAKPNAEVPVAMESEEVLRVLPELAPTYYESQDDLLTNLEMSPEANEAQADRPAKSPVEFIISTDRGEMDESRVVTINVTVRNSTKYDLLDLTFYDRLEGGLDYVRASNSSISYTSNNRTLLYSIGTLKRGEELSFSYEIKAKNKKTEKVWIHNAEIEYELRGEQVTQKASIGFADSATLVDNDALILVPEDADAGDGWQTAGRYSLYIGETVLPQDAIVSISPADVPGKGPDLQFDLNLIKTSAPAISADGSIDEQDLTLSSPLEGNFTNPAYLEINLDGVADLGNLPAGQEPYVATYEETLKIWIKVPIVNQDAATNSVTVAAEHFSTWGAGLGSSLPQNGANVLLFDQPYTSLFTGSSRYSIPIWMPAGRAGMAPDVSLSYSSSTVDGVLGDVQAPWTGVGWNIDGIEIVRKITTNSDGYGYVNDFALTLNGALYNLKVDSLHPNRYYTDHDAFLYIERHNYALDNEEYKGATPVNTTGEWWEVVTTDGTRYRLGWNEDSEQLALMYGYKCAVGGENCTTPDGAYATLGYAGKAENLVALRWRVDLITEIHGNYIEYDYFEIQPSGGTTIAPFDRESYLESISYTGYHNADYPDKELAPAYQVHFVYSPRTSIGDVPTTFNVWDNVDSKLLDKIEVCYLDCSETNVVRTYDFGYSLATVPNANGTLTLTSVDVTGRNGQNVVSAPTIRFAYQNLDNRAVTGSDSKYTYPRLKTIDNGAGGLLTYTYEHDGRGTDSWYNYRVRKVQVESGLGTAALQSYTYSTPVYTGIGSNQTLGSLIGYPTVTENQLDFNNNESIILGTRHTFGTQGLDVGRETQTEWLSGGTTVQRKVTNIYVTDNSKAPYPGWNFRYLYSTLNYELSGSSLVLTSKVIYKKDPGTGNLLVQMQYLGNTVYRKTYYEYLTNPIPSVYILDRVSRVLLVDGSNQIWADTRYHYDEQINTAPTLGDLTLTQRLRGVANETSDTATHYDIYGNVERVEVYPTYGVVNVQPTGTSYPTSTVYDEDSQTYPVQVTNALGQSSSTLYIEKLGLPYQVTDPNGWATTTTYDGLGRTLSVNAPGLSQPGVYYTYPEVNASGRIPAPYSVEMQILDTTAAGQYRSVWGIYDGMGRMIQTQVFDAGYASGAGGLLVSDSFFNTQGLAYKQSQPYYVSQGGGYYVAPSGTSFTVSTFDALGRVLTTTQPGGIVTTMEYDGLSATTIDPNQNRIKRTTDALGRMITVKEYSDAATLYSVTQYAYDVADHLVRVTDARGNVTQITYDLLGRKTGMDDPDMGIWTYGYDALGNLKTQTDGRNQVLNFNYDALNRLLTKMGTGINSSFTYGTSQGTIGMRVAMSDGSGSTDWTYADFGRDVTETRTIGGQTETLRTVTDWLGRPLSTIYPDAEVLSYTYDALGRPTSLDSSANAGASLVEVAYNLLGQITNQTLGNSVLVTNSYENGTNRLDTRVATNSSGQILNFDYQYDPAGNITQIIDAALGETHTYQYDFLNRLTSAQAYTTGSPTDYKYQQE